jgi:hypothetical protein
VADWQVVFETDADNVRAALRWLIDSGQVASAQQLGSMLARSWQMGNSLDEGRGWLAELLRLPVADPATRAQVLLADGLLAIYQADFVAARAHLEKGAPCVRVVGDEVGVAQALFTLGAPSRARVVECVRWCGSLVPSMRPITSPSAHWPIKASGSLARRASRWNCGGIVSVRSCAAGGGPIRQV